jgi:hypothetical protein
MRIALAAAALMGALSLAACGAGGGGGGAESGEGGSKGAQSTGGGGLFGLGGGQNREEQGGAGGGAGPSVEELMQALENAHPGYPIVSASLNQCREGREGGKVVQVCDMCFVAVAAGFTNNTFERGMFLKAVRRNGSAVFRRAMSPDQPGVEPGANQRGVWLASNIQLRPGRETKALSGDLMRRAGHQRRAGFGTFVKWGIRSGVDDDEPIGEKVSETVAGKFASDAQLRSESAALVAPCGDAAAAQPR